ncbi:MAG TPA: hypothetical protein VET65_08365 [Candidatus Limnocylindrales bacterium]|nr:hypothetical protein [Candidatus Limnocylindrales bacterium]
MSEAAESLRTQPAPASRPSILANRGIWKQAIYTMAFLTYLCSFLFFGLAAAAVGQSGPTVTAMFDMAVAIYFLLQVLFLFVLSWFVERRRQVLPISFPDRRT